MGPCCVALMPALLQSLQRLLLVFPSGRDRMRFEPQRASDHGRIDLMSFPPGRLISAAVDFPIVSATHGDGELITHFSCEGAALCKSNVVSI
jgi:hypothetical protein